MSTNSVDAINALKDFSAQSDNGIITITIDQTERKMNVIGEGFNLDALYNRILLSMTKTQKA